MAQRIGIGYDVHRLAKGRQLVLGGVVVPFDLGLLGHSDADVLVHAVCDAILGAAGLGDLGRHFPDNDPGFKGISSLILLEKCSNMMAEKGFTISNIDAVIIAQEPKLASYNNEMVQNIAGAAVVEPSRVNIKATTTERLGLTGRGEGMAAQAVVLITK